MLIDTYKKLFESPKEWKYYNKLPSNVFPFDNESEANNFINEYFKKGSKQSVLDPNFPTDKLRTIHTISTFFLGILLKPLCNLPVLKPDFKYLWFITCLYHDYGYCIENNKVDYPPQKYDLAAIKKKLNIKNHDLLKTNHDSLFNPSTIENYYKYCQEERRIINHGIVGGLLLYDGLKKNFENNQAKAEAEAEALGQSSSFNPEDFEYNNLHWASSHEKFYKKASSSIISHNIWFASKDEDKEKYGTYDLDELIIDNPDKYIKCSKENSFLFLLLLADTIEPVKAFSQWKYDCILEKINIEKNIDDREITITVIDTCIEYQDWFSRIINLKNWLKVSVNKESNNQIKIKIE